TIATFFPAPANVQVVQVGPSDITWTWQAIPGALGYEVRINGGSWQAPSGTLSHQVTGLTPGDVVIFDVRALGGSINCPPAISSDTLDFVVCTLNATLDSTTPIQCFGTSTGSAMVSAMNASPPLQFLADGQGAAFATGNLNQVFPAGPHFVVVADQTGCRDTVSFVLTEPDVLDLTVTKTDVLCNGDNTGTATATATGGTGTVTFQWQGCLGGAVINNAVATGLLAGCYSVTATDAGGCTATATITLNEPVEYQFTASQNAVSCFGGTDGSISISVTGNTAPYTFLWDDGQTMSTATGLAAGFHVVTVSDANGCQAATLVKLLEPTMLVVDSTASREVSCFGGTNGTATVFVTGGTLPYQYKWTDLQTTQKAVGLTSGTYSVTVTDAHNCTVLAMVTVGTPQALTVNFTNIGSEKCAGDCQGSATVLVTGGMQPYTYAWDNPVILPNVNMPGALCPGNYTVTVQDVRGCTQSNQLTIQGAVPLNLNFTPTLPSCAGLSDGNINTTVMGGSSPYSFLWSNGSTQASPQNLPCGDYSVTVTDNVGCMKVDTVKITCPASVQIIAQTSQPVSCFGQSNGSLEVQAQGGTGTLQYLWSDPNGQTTPLAQNLPAGAYRVTITDAKGCTTVALDTVGQPNLLTVSLLPTNVPCYGTSDGRVAAVPLGGTRPYQYAWNIPATDSLLINLPVGA
ncbi:MAG: hypothetical protein ABIO24_13340, partial [Saprospiraceae bacterium]